MCLAACSSAKLAPGSPSGGDDASTPDSYVAPLTTNGLTLTSEVFASGTGGNLEFLNVEAAAGSACALQRQSSCLVQDCRGGSGALQGVSAGQIALNNGSTSLLTINPGAPTMLYAEASASSPPWGTGDSLQFVAAGGSVPAFDVPLTAPGPVVVTRPVITAGSALTIDHAAGLVLAWQATSDGVTIELVQSDSAGDLASTLRVLCEFQGGPGAAIVPPSIVALFSTDATLSNTINVGGSTSIDTTLGGYWVHASLVNAQSSTFTIQ
jgi:hypothetical protein